ncbi:NfeD family protein [Facklamia sp. P12932]|uniref:NfeD family protein n=1 Tax=Facklamia sp. P12932 TaxID=3421947 RepID=UPI003D175BC3
MLISFFLAISALVVSLYTRWTWLLWSIAAVLFAMFFGIEGQAILHYLIFMIGVILLILEVYIPDLGLTGSVGLIAFILGLWLKFQDLSTVTLIVLASLAIVLILFLIFNKMGYNLQFSPDFILDKAINKDANSNSETKDHTYLASLVGKEGITVGGLRPVGKIKVDDHYFEAYSLEEMIAANQPIQIVKVVDKKIYVRSEMNG